MEINGYIVSYNPLSNKTKAIKKSAIDDINNKTCKLVKKQNQNSITIGDEYNCNPGDGIMRTFYVLEVKDKRISLIMNKNIGSLVAWSSDDQNHKNDLSRQALTVKDELEKNTSKWTNVIAVSLPSAQQIANAGGDTEWTDTVYTGKRMPPWLYDYTYGCIYDGCNIDDNSNYGYWTSTATSDYPDLAWYMTSLSYLYRSLVNDGSRYGVRPVITVSISNLI